MKKRRCNYCKEYFKQKNVERYCAPKCNIMKNALIVNGCWVWQGYNDKNGIPIINTNGLNTSAHIYSYRTHYGFYDTNIRNFYQTCGNRICVNPEHIKPGLKKDYVVPGWVEIVMPFLLRDIMSIRQISRITGVTTYKLSKLKYGDNKCGRI